jgi:hypothetical protein
VLLVRLADRVAQPSQEGWLEVRRVHDEAPSRLRDAGELPREGVLVLNVLHHVHDGHAVESSVGEGEPALRDEVHVRFHEVPYRAHGFLREVARGPGAPPAPQEQAHDAIVRAEVEAAEAAGGSEGRRELGDLPLLQDGLVEEPQGPRAISHGAPPAG